MLSLRAMQLTYDWLAFLQGRGGAVSNSTQSSTNSAIGSLTGETGLDDFWVSSSDWVLI